MNDSEKPAEIRTVYCLVNKQYAILFKFPANPIINGNAGYKRVDFALKISSMEGIADKFKSCDDTVAIIPQTYAAVEIESVVIRIPILEAVDV